MHHDKNSMKTLWGRPTRWLCIAALLIGATTCAVGAQAEAPGTTMGEVVIDPNQARVEGNLIKFIAFQKDSDVRDGLRLLAKLCKVNIVPSSSVNGPLSCPELRDVTFDQALAAMLGDKFVSEQEGNLIHIRTKEEDTKIKEDPARMIHKVITLYYITAEEAEKLIRPVLSATAQVAKTTAAETELASSGSSTSLTGGGGGDKMATNDMIVLFDFPENIEKAEAVIQCVDTRPMQVLVEATIMRTSLEETMEVGVDWNLLSGVAIDNFPAKLVGGQGTPMETVGIRPNVSTNTNGGLKIGFSSDNVQAIISAFETASDTTVLANPKILAVNKQEGSVLIGDKYGYVDQTTQTQTSTSSSVSFLESGTRLVFRPYIGNDGYIRMDIYPKVSDGTIVNALPQEKTTELKTNIIVRDGETIVIGGLFSDSVVTSRTQVPLLGNLPLIGAAFRGTSDTVEHHEIIILLTPHIIEEPSETAGSDRADDIRMKMDGARQGLQAIDRARLAEDAYARAARYYLEGDVDSAVYNVKVALMMRPTYLEARRLQERIIAETDPEKLKRIDSIVEQAIDQQEAANWRRR